MESPVSCQAGDLGPGSEEHTALREQTWGLGLGFLAQDPASLLFREDGSEVGCVRPRGAQCVHFQLFSPEISGKSSFFNSQTPACLWQPC